MATIFYLHWHSAEAAAHARFLKAAGHQVRTHSNVETIAAVGKPLPDAFVISLDRLPSHGRAVAAVLWEAEERRSIPLVFVGGKSDKIADTKAKFPAAIYCQRDHLLSVLKSIETGMINVPEESKTRRPSTSGYSGKPLAQKLGLAAGQRVAFLNVPEDWSELIGPMPVDVQRFDKPGKNLNLAVVFATKRSALAQIFPKLTGCMADKGMIWVSWPRKTSKMESDLDENIVREIGLVENWVDVKVCAVSHIWSGLKFLRRRRT